MIAHNIRQLKITTCARSTGDKASVGCGTGRQVPRAASFCCVYGVRFCRALSVFCASEFYLRGVLAL